MASAIYIGNTQTTTKAKCVIGQLFSLMCFINNLGDHAIDFQLSKQRKGGGREPSISFHKLQFLCQV